MTVQELINELNKIEDKSVSIWIPNIDEDENQDYVLFSTIETDIQDGDIYLKY